MIEIMEGSAGKVVGLKVQGKVTAADFDALAPKLEGLIAEHGKLRLLSDVTALGGMEPKALWDDVIFSMKHFRDFERVAIVGDAAWEAWMAKLAAPLSPAEVRHFPSSRIDDAWSWLRG